MSRPLRQRFTCAVPAAAAILAVTLAGCSRTDEVTGSPDMPGEYGDVKRNVLGCADLSGLYAWPPVDAATQDATAAAGRAKGAPPTLAPLRLPLYPVAQVWLEGPNGLQGMQAHTRMVNRDPRVRNRLTAEWSLDTVERASMHCRGAWVEVLGPIETDPVVAGKHGGKAVQQGARLAKLRDGSLAMGQWTRASGREQSVDVWRWTLWTYPIGDRVTWRWQRLARLGETGRDLPPDDVALQAAPGKRAR